MNTQKPSETHTDKPSPRYVPKTILERKLHSKLLELLKNRQEALRLSNEATELAKQVKDERTTKQRQHD